MSPNNLKIKFVQTTSCHPTPGAGCIGTNPDENWVDILLCHPLGCCVSIETTLMGHIVKITVGAIGEDHLKV